MRCSLVLGLADRFSTLVFFTEELSFKAMRVTAVALLDWISIIVISCSALLQILQSDLSNDR